MNARYYQLDILVDLVELYRVFSAANRALFFIVCLAHILQARETISMAAEQGGGVNQQLKAYGTIVFLLIQ